MTIIGGGTVNLKGRTTGSSYAGFLMIAAGNATHVSNIQGGGSFNMEGVVYLPKQTVYVTGNGDANGSSNVFAMVARNFDFRGNGSNVADVTGTNSVVLTGTPVVGQTLLGTLKYSF